MNNEVNAKANRDLDKFIRLMVGNGANNIPLNKLMHGGNTKLPTETAIFSMGPAKTCASKKLGFCQAVCNGKNCCYAKKAEDFRPTVLPYRMKQEKYWKSTTATEFITQFLIINNFKLRPYKALRFNESGDFHSQECVDKAEKIARGLKKFGIKVYGYTARKDLDFSKVRNLILLGSNFCKDGVRGTFKMILNKKDRPKGYGLCIGDCSKCNRCLRGLNTAIIKH